MNAARENGGQDSMTNDPTAQPEPAYGAPVLHPEPADPAGSRSATLLEDGLDEHREAVVRMMADDVASNALGIRVTAIGQGRATCQMTVLRSMLNGHLIGHGGYIFLLADTAFACACNSYGPVTVAQGVDINFVRPVHEGDVLVAEAVETARTGRSGVYDITVSNHEGVVAVFRGRSRTIGK